ncbi:MAG: non-canonical purine NTP pyrophosphatase [Spirochaetales bacterium]|nr:non-canonical purine NTP pyrophosphatase [Spirochaetales bacterium]
MHTVLLATNNDHKRREMEGICRQLDAAVTIVQPRDVGFRYDCDETGDTFSANAWLKAWGLFRLIRGAVEPHVSVDDDPRRIVELARGAFGSELPPVLADDSGICVHALDNRPGVFSARFGDEPGRPKLDDEARNDLLLEHMHGIAERSSHYVCNACLITAEDRHIQVQETWHGAILAERRPGDTGFGYDPVVWLADYECSVAQLPSTQKDRISHRAKAVRALAAAAGWRADGP